MLWWVELKLVRIFFVFWCVFFNALWPKVHNIKQCYIIGKSAFPDVAQHHFGNVPQHHFKKNAGKYAIACGWELRKVSFPKRWMQQHTWLDSDSTYPGFTLFNSEDFSGVLPPLHKSEWDQNQIKWIPCYVFKKGNEEIHRLLVCMLTVQCGASIFVCWYLRDILNPLFCFLVAQTEMHLVSSILLYNVQCADKIHTGQR